MKPEKALEIFKFLLHKGRETECAEWKEAKNSFDSDNLGRYFSALSNEANLHGNSHAWFIMGVANDGTIVGTNYRKDSSSLDSIKHEIAQQVSNNLTFQSVTEIHPEAGRRVLLFEIPVALAGIPTSWKGHYFGRDGGSLVALNLKEIEKIRGQAILTDWSAEICETATIDDLDFDALKKARLEFTKKNGHLAGEVEQWDNVAFLNKVKLARNDRITRTAIILLGRAESEVHLSPSVAAISWILKDDQGMEMDYAHFGPPWILNGEKAYGKIRNLRYRHMPDGTLFPIEVDQYDQWVIREALHNCIAHQDYTKCSRISLVEFPDKIVLQNAGSFIPRSIEEVIERDAPESRYRNPFLCGAMVNLNMIDTIGSGIKKMFQMQRSRCFPLPDYDIRPEAVSVTIMGRILDSHYVQLLANDPNLPLQAVMLLDLIQKKKIIGQENAKRLRAMNLVEGRYPRLFISSPIAALAKQKASYLHNRGLDNQHYSTLIVEHIHKFGSITRKEADDLLIKKLPDVLDPRQKKSKVHNILTGMVKSGTIKNIASRARPAYVLGEGRKSPV